MSNMAAASVPSRRSRLSRLSRLSRPLALLGAGSSNGLGWMVLAQVFFAAMNVCTRLGARELPWSEIAAARFLVGALIALGLARYRGSPLRITDGPNTW